MVLVDEVGGEFPFALHVDDASQSDVVSHALHHLGRLLRHLEAEGKGEECLKTIHVSLLKNLKHTFLLAF